MAAFVLHLPSSVSTRRTTHLKYFKQPPRHRAQPILSLKSTTTTTSPPPHPLISMKPFIQSQWKPILQGWLCSSISIYSLSKLVPKFGALSSNLTPGGLREEGLTIDLLVLVRLIGSYLQQAFLWDAALNCIYKLRVYVFNRVLDRELGFFESSGGVSGGDIAYRITAEASDVADTIFALLNTIVPSALQLSAMAMQMVSISPSLSLVSAVMIPCMVLVIAYSGQKLRRISKEANLSIAALSSYLNEVLPSILFVKANNAELNENVRFNRLVHMDLSKQLKKRKMKVLFPQIVQMIYFGALVVICAGSLLFFGNSFNGPRLVAFVTSLILLIEPIQAISRAYNDLKQGEPAIERLFDMTRFKDQVIDKPDAVDLESVSGEVRFLDVSFRYGDDTPFVLNGLDLHIRAGETIALAGPSGGGKSTLVKLLLRLYDPSAGSILVDGHDIQGIRIKSLRSHIGLVSQDITLFSGTVAENIGFKDLMTKIDMDRIEYAAEIANAKEFISRLPQGYETNIGLRGSILSGGQKQRLAIARALYQNASILILDEATSALDTKSELLVRQALHRLMKDHTVLVIAHRLETLLMANRVFLLDCGQLREVSMSALSSGDHESLLSMGLVI